MTSRFIPITPKTKLSVAAGRNLTVPSERPSPRRSLRQAVWIFELDPRTAFASRESTATKRVCICEKYPSCNALEFAEWTSRENVAG